MVNALWITLIGMGLVFASIIVLWGLMALLVRLTAEKEPPACEAADEVQPAEEMAAAEAVESSAQVDRKRRAAAAAVAVALSLRKPAQPVRAQPGSSLSAWQAINRANQISQQAYSSRKKVVR